jgi:hypothetical protein
MGQKVGYSMCCTKKNQTNQNKQTPTDKCNRPELNRVIYTYYTYFIFNRFYVVIKEFYVIGIINA